MAPQDDLTAERAAKLAAFELVKKLTDNAGMDPNDRWDKVNLLLAYRQTARQEALRDVLHESLNLKYYHAHNGVQALHDWVKDRLASEGG